ncbi:hypothetical protein ACIGEZ_19090 [Streptomyces sp. NPDC085481]|uniref:hypothetical protein n=1 Tax=Streptomyces sp. NPDC085481 TaxID=3365727 RepID=UPI0037D3AC33
MTDALPPDLAFALDALLDDDDPVHEALRRQLPHLRTAGCCSCGCGTTDFALDTSAVPPAPAEDGVRTVAGRLFEAEDGSLLGELVLFAQDGYLSWLEVCDLTALDSDVKVTLELAVRSLKFPAAPSP